MLLGDLEMVDGVVRTTLNRTASWSSRTTKVIARHTHLPYPALLTTDSQYLWMGTLEKDSLTSSACLLALLIVRAMPWSSLPCELRLQVLESAIAHELTSYDELEYGGPAFQARAHAVSLIRSVCHEWRVRLVGLVRLDELVELTLPAPPFV
jgi:hypothetical protein